MFSTTVPSTRRPFSVPLLAAAASLAIAFAAVGSPAAGQDADLDAQGAALVNEFVEILKQPDTEKAAALADFLADEFQIVRNNGTRLDKAGYIENPATVFEVEISDVQATEADGVMVVSYTLSVNETIDGVDVVSVAPRLSVFHRSETGDWQIAAHANFGVLNPS